MKQALSQLSKNKKLWLLLFSAFFIRLFLAYFQYSGDIRNHLAWADSFLNQVVGFYSRPISGFETPNYPPLTIYLFSISRVLYHWFSQASVYLNKAIGIFPSKLIFLLPTLNMQAAFLKLPAILADLGIGFLIYKFVSLRKNSRPLLYTLLFLFNPAVIYVSTVWGQIESLPIFFILLSVYLGKQKTDKGYYLSHLSYLLAALSKQTALWLLPVFIVYWFKRSDFKRLLKGLLLQFAVFLLFYLPFTGFSLQSLSLYTSTLKGSSDLISDAAWNLWHFVYSGQRISDSTLLLGISVRLWSIIILFVFYLKVLSNYLSSKKQTIFYVLLILSLSAFFFQTRVHERHLFPVLVFILLVPTSKKNLQLTSYFLVSAFHFFNLYWTLGLPFI